MKRKRMAGLLLFGLVLFPVSGWCAGDDEENVAAIQNRIFHKYHEVALSAGY